MICFAGNLPRTTDSLGNPLPSPRLISSSVSTAESHLADVSNMVMAWGQFIDHDFTGTPVIKSKEPVMTGPFSLNTQRCQVLLVLIVIEVAGPSDETADL